MGLPDNCCRTDIIVLFRMDDLWDFERGAVIFVYLRGPERLGNLLVF